MKKQGRVLIVDDNTDMLKALELLLSDYFEMIKTLSDPGHLMHQLEKEAVDLVLLDMNFKSGIHTGNEGLYWLKRIREHDPRITVVFITAFGDVDLAVRSMKEGASDFIQKSWDENKILSTVLAAFRLHQSQEEIYKLKSQKTHLNHELAKEQEFWQSTSRTMVRLYETIEKIKDTQANILILGENGTGKEVIARDIHRRSGRKNELFVPVDLGSLSETLLESELFGHVKGAFTDAVSDRQGRFEIASGGTLFLDEIANLSPHSQSKILSAIQNRCIYRVGSSKPIAIDTRLICATNEPIFDRVGEGWFRKDLLYRINTIQIDVPPLRERMDDIPGLSEFFLRKFSDKYRKKGFRLGISAVEQLQKYAWPGNIRQLQHAIEKAVILNEPRILKSPDFDLGMELQSTISRPDNFNLKDHEKMVIEQALKKFHGNISLCAEKLGINRSTLYSKIRTYDIQTL
jgi:DNA-binding NtrC family response regulator